MFVARLRRTHPQGLRDLRPAASPLFFVLHFRLVGHKPSVSIGLVSLIIIGFAARNVKSLRRI